VNSVISGSVAALLALTAATAANATSISGNGNPASDPALAGGTQVTFSGLTNGSYPSLDLGAVTISGVGGNVNIDTTYAGQYNTTGTYLDNNQGSTTDLLFTFDSAVSAFGFNLGAHDSSWTITAYNGATLLDTFTFGAIGGSNAGEYYGLSVPGITSAHLSTTDSYDWILLDNFTFVTGGTSSGVPEPTTWAMMLVGFGAVGFSLRRRKPAAVAQIA